MESFFQCRRLTRRQWLRVLAVSLLLAGAAVVYYLRDRERQMSAVMRWPPVHMVGAPADRNEFKPVRVVRPFEPITDFDVVDGATITDQLNQNELVIGVTAGEVARAYPINMLTGPDREILNDTLGGAAIAATW